MQTLPFYSLLSRENSVAVWHDNEACSLAQGIALADRRAGRDHLRAHCPECVKLNPPVVRFHHGQGAYSDVLAGLLHPGA
jgi:hypothetical protein